MIPKNRSHAVNILHSILSREMLDNLLEVNEYSHFGIGLFIRNKLLYFENPYWEVHSPDDMSKFIYNDLMIRLKSEKLFSRRELKNFFKEPKKYASAKFLSDVNYMQDSKDFRGVIARTYKNREVLFSQDKSNNAFLLTTGDIYHFDSVYEYFLEGSILTIGWSTHQSIFELYDDFIFDIKLKKRDDIGERLYKILTLKAKDFYERDESFGFKIHDKELIKIEDIKDDILKNYFNNQNVPLDIWQNTILMKCFDINPDFELEHDFNGLDYSGLPWWMSEYEASQFTECLSIWKESHILSNKDVENIEKVKYLTHSNVLDKVIKSAETDYNIEVLKTITSVYKLHLNLSDVRYAKNIYLTLYANLKMEKYFTKEKIRAFRTDEKNHSNCICISDKCTDIYKDSYRISIESYENKYALIRFDKTKKIFSIFTTSTYIWINFSEYKNIHEYSIVNNQLNISYGDKISVFELFGDVIYD